MTDFIANLFEPPGCKPDARAASTDDLADVEHAVRNAVLRAAKFPPHRGIELQSVDVTAVPVLTIPECRRKSVLVSLLVEVQVDGDDLDANVAGVSEALSEIAERIV